MEVGKQELEKLLYAVDGRWDFYMLAGREKMRQARKPVA